MKATLLPLLFEKDDVAVRYQFLLEFQKTTIITNTQTFILFHYTSQSPPTLTNTEELLFY